MVKYNDYDEREADYQNWKVCNLFSAKGLMNLSQFPYYYTANLLAERFNNKVFFMSTTAITPLHATKILLCFQEIGIVGVTEQYKTVYRDPNSNFVCNVHSGRRGLTLELQNPESNPPLTQIMLAIAGEPVPSQPGE